MASETINEMRLAIKGVYPGLRWESKVNAMDDGQVRAIYYSFMNRRVFDRPKGLKKPGDPSFRQLTLWDFGVKKV